MQSVLRRMEASQVACMLRSAFCDVSPAMLGSGRSLLLWLPLRAGMGIRMGAKRTRLYGLNLSRCLGDKFLKDEDMGLSAQPHVSPVLRADAQLPGLAIIASDGLWDVTDAANAFSVSLSSSSLLPAVHAGLCAAQLEQDPAVRLPCEVNGEDAVEFLRQEMPFGRPAGGGNSAVGLGGLRAGSGRSAAGACAEAAQQGRHQRHCHQHRGRTACRGPQAGCPGRGRVDARALISRQLMRCRS